MGQPVSYADAAMVLALFVGMSLFILAVGKASK